MRFQVPQDVQREDKILGPLTIKQLIIAIVGGGIGWIMWTTLNPAIATPIIVFIVALTICFLFVRINEMPFYQYIPEMILFILKPRQRTWQKGIGEISMFSYIRVAKTSRKKDSGSLPVQSKDPATLIQLSLVLDSRGRWNENVLEKTKKQEEIDALDDADFFQRTMGA